MDQLRHTLILGDSRSFELPKHNQIWQRPETQRILERCGLNYDAEVALCQTGLVNDEGTPIGKRLKFFATSPCFANLLTRKLELVHADIMRNSTPSIGIAQAITARRWQRPSWQQRGLPEGNLADILLHVHARIHVVKAQRVAASLSLECVELTDELLSLKESFLLRF